MPGLFISLDDTKELYSSLEPISISPISLSNDSMIDAILLETGFDADNLRAQVETESEEVRDNVEKMISNARESINSKLKEADEILKDLSMNLVQLPLSITSTALASGVPTSTATGPALASSTISTYNKMIESSKKLTKIFVNMGVGIPTALSPIFSTISGISVTIESLMQILIPGS